MTFCCGSGSADSCLWLMDPDLDLDPAIFVIYLQDANKKEILLTKCSAYYFLKVHLHHFSKIKSQKKAQRNQSFSYYVWKMIEGSGSEPGSGWPKNMWIPIRNRNTARNLQVSTSITPPPPSPFSSYLQHGSSPVRHRDCWIGNDFPQGILWVIPARLTRLLSLHPRPRWCWRLSSDRPLGRLLRGPAGRCDWPGQAQIPEEGLSLLSNSLENFWIR